MVAVMLCGVLAGCKQQPVADDGANRAANAVTASDNLAAPANQAVVEDGSAPEAAIAAAFGQTRSFKRDDLTYDYVAHKIVQAEFGPVLLSQASAQDGAHVSSGYLTITYLKPKGDGFMVGQRFPEAVTSGSFGAFSDFSVRRDLTRNPIVAVEGGGVWQGHACGWTSLTELTAKGPVERASFEDSYSNGGATPDGEKATDVEGAIVSAERDRSFTVRFKGTRNFDGVYERKGETYVLRGGDGNALNGC